ncbi:MAG: reverse transcriptase domain-containing protein, partial [Aeromonas sp.]
KIFSKLDLKKGFYQVEIHEKDRNKTAFVTSMGKYEFNRVPFGLLNAPKYFHNLIQESLGHVKGIAIFVDDIIVFTKDVDEHIKVLEHIFALLKSKNIIINLEKCIFLAEQIKYLGFIIDSSGYTPDIERVGDFNKAKIPTTKKQLQSLLGKLNWYRPFIKDMSGRIYHLYDKLKGNSKKILITQKEMIPVYKIYNEVTKNAKLYFPDLNDKFFINTDASDFGIGAVLYQDKGIIGFFSKKLNDTQRKYTTTEREMLAILSAVKNWKDWIGGSEIIVHTDSKNLVCKNADLENRVGKWKAMLTEFNIKYQHISGKENIIADELSRSNQELGVCCSLKTTSDSQNFHNFINTFHINHGHPGITKTILTMNDTMRLSMDQRRIIRTAILSCKECQLNKTGKVKYGYLRGNLQTLTPMKDISSDVFGPFVLSNRGNISKWFLITFTDRCTRITRVYFTKTIGAKSFIKGFNRTWLSEFPKPDTMLSDNGKCYVSKITKSFMVENSIKQKFTSPYNPTGNSISERINANIVMILRIYKGHNFKTIKKLIEARNNKLFHTGLKAIPYKVYEEYLQKKTIPLCLTNKPIPYTSKKRKKGKNIRTMLERKF